MALTDVALDFNRSVKLIAMNKNISLLKTSYFRFLLLLQRLNQGMDDARALVDDLSSQYTQWRDSISECKINLTSGKQKIRTGNNCNHWLLPKNVNRRN